MPSVCLGKHLHNKSFLTWKLPKDTFFHDSVTDFINNRTAYLEIYAKTFKTGMAKNLSASFIGKKDITTYIELHNALFNVN